MKNSQTFFKYLIVFAAIFFPAAALAGPVEKSLFDAAKSGDTAGIRELVKKHADVNARDTDGETPLFARRRTAKKTRPRRFLRPARTRT